MKKKINLKLIKFPNKLIEAERQVEAILFSAAEPLDYESIIDKLKSKVDLQKILNPWDYLSKHFLLSSL